MNGRPLRILHVVGGLDRAGIETWLINVLRRVDRSRFQMDFLVHGTQLYPYETEATALGARVIRCLHPNNPLLYGATLYRILASGPRYDIVHSHVHFLTGFVLRIARLAGVPHRIAHSHCNTCRIDASAGLARRLQVRLSKHWLENSATRSLAVSTDAATALFGGCNSEYNLFPCGVDLTPFRERVDPAEVRSQLGLPADAWVVGHVGRFEPAKNHRMLVQIASEVAKRDSNVHFLCIGEGRLRPEIEAIVENSECRETVHFLGTRPDVHRLMRCMDAFVFPSLYEGLGLALIEAQAAGLECFVSAEVPRAADIVPELIQRLPLTDDPSTWAERIVRSSRCLNLRFSGESALSTVEQSIVNIQNNAEHLSTFYQNL